MHPHAELLEKLYTGLNAHDHLGMAECYHPDATFDDIAFHLRGKKQIHAMWHLISEGDLRASFKVLAADDRTGSADLIDDYTFRETGRKVRNVIRSTFRFQDGLIIEHRDDCDALKWGVQALGPVKGCVAWAVPAMRRAKAAALIKAFLARHPEDA